MAQCESCVRNTGADRNPEAGATAAGAPLHHAGDGGVYGVRVGLLPTLPRLFAEQLLPRAIVFHRLLFPVPGDKLKFTRVPGGPRLMVNYVQTPVLRDGRQALRNIRRTRATRGEILMWHIVRRYNKGVRAGTRGCVYDGVETYNMCVFGVLL